LVDQIGVVAGSKIEVIIVVQSFTMLEQLYSKAWDAFLGNASAIILVGSPGDHTTCDYLVRRSGERTIVMPHSGTSQNPGGFGTSAGDAYHTRPTLTHADLYSLKPGTGFIWLHGLADPIPAAFPGYYTDPVLSRRARRDPYIRW
jgi:type IV secretory pathway TraG/TraD family ATPase VirD4